MSAKTFTVELERVQKTATMFRVPFDLAGAFGRARPPVKVTIRGVRGAPLLESMAESGTSP